MTNSRQWAALARQWLALSSRQAARAMREREQEASRRRREWRPDASWRGKRADEEAAGDLEQVRWATEPETTPGPTAEELEAAREALARELALARARERARREREGR
ncbi:hypothetical protein HD597_004908 [Nonomuraea thailandensis]|uniref:Uncharacterized protein n=1 Tax=Nonomuraea thailandensis TaxID=1188745 RepID=A0A9X2GNH3_9ACTN|nr:hypothetical protein [Nonomuraea thailandensis]MCP2357888.1 hypothetical protein [Nonomuraea thailandensis]